MGKVAEPTILLSFQALNSISLTIDITGDKVSLYLFGFVNL